jgi:DNA replicative helicase MCM subunit Mcm2 (Cdc46/Mcm family)
MTDAEKKKKIKEIKEGFFKQLRKIEKVRDEKIKSIKKGIDERKIKEILSKLKGE